MHTNNLSDAELERLAILSEEASEIIQIVNKIIRHGYESFNPSDHTQTSNRRLLEQELGHFEYAKALMLDTGDIKHNNMQEAKLNKLMNRQRFLHHNVISENMINNA